MPDVCRRPGLADDVLVEVLPGAQAERESVVAHQPDGCRHLGHDRRVITHDRTGDHRHQLHLARLARDGAQYAPGEGTLALLFEPRMEVIRDHGEIESGALRIDAVARQLFGTELFTHQRVTESSQGITSQS